MRRIAGCAAMCAVLLAWSGCATDEAPPAAEAKAADAAPAGQARADAAPPAGARAQRQRRSSFRAAAPRNPETIFSPLDLPTATSIRAGSGSPGAEYWQQRADYFIETKLDDQNQEVGGTARIRYTNNSPDALPFLWLYLEQNAFRLDSLNTRMRAIEGRFGNRRPFDGGMEVTGFKLDGKDAKLNIYDTVGRVDLPVPLAAKGGQAEIEISWKFNVPQYGADRMGIFPAEQGPVFQLAQWFPAMCVYDDVNGWNTLPYLGQGEFYTNFGNFEVAISVPRGHLVAATGELQNPEEVLTETQLGRYREARKSATAVVIRSQEEVSDPAARPAGEGPLTWKFKAKDVRTFAWASSAGFIWDGCWLDWGDGTGVMVQSMYPKEAQPLWGDHATEFLRFSIDHYSKQWFRYPYPSATNVNGIVGGMEYPMIIFCAERKNDRGLFGVTTHEIGHNWFPMTVSNDERRHAWMDEGFNTFINVYCQIAKWKDAKPDRGNPRGFAASMREPDQQPVDTPADQILPNRLGTLEYAKTSIGLVMLREYVLGPERFDAAFRHYIRTWAFKSPQPSDFYRCMENAAGADLSWFWRGWFQETGTLDQAVASVRQDEKAERARVTFENRGELVMPLRFKVSYSDGSEETRDIPVEAWYTTNRFTTNWPTAGKKLTKIVIDPGEDLPDTDLSNNVWEGTAEKPGEGEPGGN